MTLRSIAMSCALVALAACQPAIPNSGVTSVPNPGQGVGFDNSLAAARAREAALRSSAPVAVTPPVVSTTVRPPQEVVEVTSTTTRQTQPIVTARTPDPVQEAQTSTRQPLSASDPSLSRVEQEADALSRSRNSGEAVVNASPSNPAPVQIENPGISDENDFAAVSSRQTIQSDAERLAANRSQYQIVRPEALPSRTTNAGPNIVAYALQTNHPKGTKVYRRSRLSSTAKHTRNCAQFPSSDQAQLTFLSRGGPQRDRLALDPDGDGYACNWDPAPFRRATSG